VNHEGAKVGLESGGVGVESESGEERERGEVGDDGGRLEVVPLEVVPGQQDGGEVRAGSNGGVVESGDPIARRLKDSEVGKDGEGRQGLDVVIGDVERGEGFKEGRGRQVGGERARKVVGGHGEGGEEWGRKSGE